MKTSVIIPTYNRKDDLVFCLDSLKNQELKPDEILIVDDSSNNDIKNYILEITFEFQNININLIYVRNNKGRSLTKARNLGVKKSTGDIIIFLDDDVILESEYIKKTVEMYSSCPDLLGTQGFITNFPQTGRILNIINRIFFLEHIEKDRCRVLPSTRITYPKNNKNMKSLFCEWLSGSNHSYRRKIFQEYEYDENMVRYSYKEDADLSCRIHKKYPNTLMLIPEARCVHNVSTQGRILIKEQIFMDIGYTYYFFHKNIQNTFINRAIFRWSNFGFYLKKTIEIILKGEGNKKKQLMYLIQGYILLKKKCDSLKDNDLKEFNEFLFPNQNN